MEKMRESRSKKSPFFRELKGIIEELLRENPYMSFSYYELRDYVSKNYRNVGNSSIKLRVMELKEEGKCEIRTCTYKKSRHEIRWLG